MAICQVELNPNQKFDLIFPVSGAGSNIPLGTLMMQGATQGTNEAIAIPTTSSGSNYIGLLAEKHNFSASGDATQATLVSWYPNGVLGSGNTAFPTHPIELVSPGVIIRMDYSVVSTVAVSSATSTALTITSEVAGFGGSFAYYNAGTGVGQIVFIKSSTTNTLTLVGATGTTADSTTKVTKVLPFFYALPILLVNTTTSPTSLDSVAGNGSGTGVILSQWAQRNNITERMDPKIYHGLTGLSSLTTFNLFAHLQMTNTVFHPS